MTTDRAKELASFGHYYAHTKEDIPQGPHFAILMPKSITYEDGYDSRHSSSTTTEQVFDYIVFRDREAWQKAIIENTTRTFGQPWKGIPMHVNPAAVNVTVQVNVEVN